MTPTLASKATAELPKLPEPTRMSADQAYLGYTADQMNAHYLAGVEAGRASRAGSEPVTIPERNALLRLLVAEVTRLQTLFTDALGDTQQESAAVAPVAAAEPSERTEQSAFEDWLELNCPSGDVESVQRQWLSSRAHEDWYDEQCNAAATPVPPDREGMVLVPRELLQAASKSLGSFVSEEGWTQQDMDVMDSIDAALAARSSAGEAQS